MTARFDHLPDPTKCPHGEAPGTCFYCGDLDAARDAVPAAPIPDLIEAEPETITIGARTERNETKGAANEDALLVDERSRTYGVLDGMGGHAAGEVASAKAAQRILEEMARMPKGIRHDGAQVAEYLRSAVLQAGGSLQIMAEAEPKLRGMGTTCSLIHVVESPDAGTPREAVVVHVGDSRVYRLRNGALERLTKDHSPIQQSADAGELPPNADQVGDPEADARLAPEQRELVRRTRNVISQAVGHPNIQADIARVPLAEDDILLATTDGVHDNLTDREIAAIAREHARDPVGLSAELVRTSRERSRDRAHVRHKDDDISAVAVRIGEASA